MGVEGAATGVSGAGTVAASILAANAGATQVAGNRWATMLPTAGIPNAFRGNDSAFIPVQHIPLTPPVRTPAPTLWPSKPGLRQEALSGMALMGIATFPDMQELEPGYENPTIAAVGGLSMLVVLGGLLVAVTWQDLKAYLKKSFLFSPASVNTEKAAAEALEATRSQAGFQRSKHTLRDIEPRGFSIPPPADKKDPGVRY